MSRPYSAIEEWNVVHNVEDEALATAIGAEERRLRQLVALYTIGCALGPSTLIWDVQKLRLGTVAHLVGQHATEAPGDLHGCPACAALRGALIAVAAYSLPSEMKGCHHMIGGSSSERNNDEGLAGLVHQVQLSVSFIHRVRQGSADSPDSVQCVAQFYSSLKGLGVVEAPCVTSSERKEP